MAKNSITGQQAEFCRLYAVSENGVEAYQKAYPKASYNAAKSSATDLLSKANIQAEVARLRKPADKAVKLTLADKHKILHEIAWDKEVQPQHRIAAVIADGKYAGDYAPEKQEVTITHESPEAAIERAAAMGIDLTKILKPKE